MSTTEKILIFGAGNIGRGFLAELSSGSGLQTVFVDTNTEMVSLLNQNKGYSVNIVGEKKRQEIVKKYYAIDANNTPAIENEFTIVDTMATAVGANALKSVSPLIAAGIRKRADSNILKPLNIIVAENLLSSSSVLKKFVLSALDIRYHDYINNYVGFAVAVVRRRVPYVTNRNKEQKPLTLFAEDYSILPVDREGIKGHLPEIKGVELVPNIDALMEQKLFLHNGMYAITGYLGYSRGYKFLHEAITDRDIYKIVKEASFEIAKGLTQKHGFLLNEQGKYIIYLLELFANKELTDLIEGIIRHPLRKLGVNDRLVGTAKLALDYDIVPENIISGILAALQYDNPNDDEAVQLNHDLKTKGIDAILEDICGLRPDEKLTQLIKERFSLLNRQWQC